MKSIFIEDLRPKVDLLNEPFLLQDVAERTTKDGRPFILFTLQDKTGTLSGVFWDVPAAVLEWARPGQPVLVSGRINLYKDALQVNATDLNPSFNEELTDFLPFSTRPIDEMIGELQQVIDSLAEPWQGLAKHLLLNESFLNEFANAPAARNMHHAVLGGLLEHTLSMAAIAGYLADHYPHVNRNLLLTGVLLHDMGKPLEYDVDNSFAFTEDGRLVGHIVRAIVMIETAAAELGTMPADDVRQLVHLVASHHGNLEWGSPVVPKTLEAVLLHQIDLLDSRVQGFLEHASTDTDANGWTIKPSPMFRTELKRPSTL
ncbi:MAG: HD domain-containing protein [Ardenticatenaceae bacterium]|nr:HD domain-containing protein [Ardenticatenaceae bacterium]